jgi:hypothetical protein
LKLFDYVWVFVNLWEVEAFLKSRIYGCIVSKFKVFFKNYELQFFSKNLDGHTNKFMDSGIFRVNCYEIRDVFEKSWSTYATMQSWTNQPIGIGRRLLFTVFLALRDYYLSVSRIMIF